MQSVTECTIKAKRLEYFRMIEETGEDVIVTSRGKPVIRISRLETLQSVEDLFGDVRGKVILGDEILEPETAEWPEV